MCNKRQNVLTASIIPDSTLAKSTSPFSSLFYSPPSVNPFKPQVETIEVFLTYLLAYDVCSVFLGEMGSEKQLLKDKSASHPL